MHNGLLTWRAPSRVSHVKTTRWYAIAGILTLTLVAYALATGAWSVAIVMMLSAAVYILMQKVDAHEYQVTIAPEGIGIDGQITPWARWDAFWILVGDDYAELHLRPSRKNRRDFVVLLADLDPLDVYQAIRPFLHDDPTQKEKVFDMILRICKL